MKDNTSNQISNPLAMSEGVREGAAGSFVPTAAISASLGSGRKDPQSLSFSPQLPEAPTNSTNGNSTKLKIPCPVPTCSLVFDGQYPHGYLWRHLQKPGVSRCTPEEKAARLRLHEIECKKLTESGFKPSQPKRDRKGVNTKPKCEQRVKKMRMTDKSLITQKLAIREGMKTAKQSQDIIGHCAWTLLDIFTSP